MPAKIMVVFDRIIDFLAYAAAGGVVFIMLTLCVEIAGRKLFNYSLPWATQFSEYALCYITFLGVAWVLKREGHVKIDVIVNRLNPRNQQLLNLVTSIIGACLSLLLGCWGVILTYDLFQRGVYDPTLIEVPKGVLIAVMPLGFLLLFIQSLRKAHKHLGGWRASETGGK